MRKSFARSFSRGQTILELCFFLMWLSGFLVLAYWMFSVFDVSQKQTMLLRSQAFIELGNYADFSHARMGEHSAKDKESRVVFELGKKSDKTHVNFDEVESFKDAVQGELLVDVLRSVRDDYYYDQFKFPKAKTKVSWLLNDSAQGLIDFDAEQKLVIVHNLSLDLKKDLFNPLQFGTQEESGLYSGSLDQNSFYQLYADRAGLQQIEVGMKDNLDLLKDRIRQLVKDDPSLVREAEDLEKHLNAAESLVGGAISNAVGTALQLAMQFGFQALGNALNAAGSAAGGAGGFDPFGLGSLFKPLEGSNLAQFGQLLGKASTLMNLGNFAGSLAGADTGPLGQIASVTGGLSGLANGAAGLGVAGNFGQYTQAGQQLLGGLNGVVSPFAPQVSPAFGAGLGALSIAGGAYGFQNATAGFQSFQSAGSILGGAGGIAGAAGAGSAAQYLNLGASTTGFAGNLGQVGVQGFSNLPGGVAQQLGGFLGQAAGVGGQIQTLSGGDASVFGVPSLAGGALQLGGQAQNYLAQKNAPSPVGDDFQNRSSVSLSFQKSLQTAVAGAVLAWSGDRQGSFNLEEASPGYVYGQYEKLSRPRAYENLSAGEKHEFDKNLDLTKLALKHFDESNRHNQLPDPEIISSGLEASLKLSDILDRWLGRPARGTKAREAYDEAEYKKNRERLDKIHQQAVGELNNDREVSELVRRVDAVNIANGIVVKNAEEKSWLQKIASKNAKSIASYVHEHPGRSDASRYEYAQWKWKKIAEGDVDFKSPKQALQDIRDLVDRYEVRFQKIKSSLRVAIARARS